MNNVLYAIILSAALDLVGPNIPKGVVLLADIVPAFATKLIAPYFMHLISYSARIWVFVSLSISGMLLVASSPSYAEGGSMGTKLAGIILASLSSGVGELSFLSLTHYYGPFSLAAWGSGTGAAGLVGAGAYAVATTSFGFGVRPTLLSFSCLPSVMVISFFFVLPRGPLLVITPTAAEGRYETIADLEEEQPVEELDDVEEENGSSHQSSNDLLNKSLHSIHESRTWSLFKTNLRRVQGLFYP